MSLPVVWFERPRSRDVVLLSLHASVTLGRVECWVYVAGFGVGASW